ncbi:hypothetical protein HELRODRAFT_111980 [Helobdella robusta]|uniref:U1 small nuclear ribonucleoprotein C n=1 Tax=Helobdella robusta TaxID=6412 RepID=T1EFG2_HELRO|nr:hypothetical protein HELRODRAFT_111980 [Helobdella robusta]ESO03546.1 hypothetical protein HELRODRAFT_111980 [Helobdella robusta]
MPKYYCDYCDTYLTHDSPSVRKTHCGGRKHKENVCTYYQKWLEEQVQKLVDDTTAAFKAGKIPSNPYLNGPAGLGAMIPPPMALAPRPLGPPGAPPMFMPPPMRPPMGSLPPGLGVMPPGLRPPPMGLPPMNMMPPPHGRP